jgi:hypothetical protein
MDGRKRLKDKGPRRLWRGGRQSGVIAFMFKPNLALAQDGCPPAWLRLHRLGQPISGPATVAASSWP